MFGFWFGSTCEVLERLSDWPVMWTIKTTYYPPNRSPRRTRRRSHKRRMR